jgi:hypothetical protein
MRFAHLDSFRLWYFSLSEVSSSWGPLHFLEIAINMSALGVRILRVLMILLRTIVPGGQEISRRNQIFKMKGIRDTTGIFSCNFRLIFMFT